MREKGCDYFENSRRATYVQREYALRNPHSFTGYAADCWGLSAGDGPSAEPRLVAGRRLAFFGYAARGVPYGPDDGTIAGSSTLSSLVFAPEIALPALRGMVARGLRWRRGVPPRQRLQPDREAKSGRMAGLRRALSASTRG